MKSIWIPILVLLISSCKTEPVQLSELTLELKDGGQYNLMELSNYHATAITFLAPECPLSENYCLTINKMQESYKPNNIQFVSVIPGELYSAEEIDLFIRKYKLQTPLLLDTDKKLTNLLGATVTPEVFVIDSTFEVQYSGAIDNWAVELGQKREVITEFYLSDALNAIIGQYEPKISHTPAVGCFIE